MAWTETIDFNSLLKEIKECIKSKTYINKSYNYFFAIIISKWLFSITFLKFNLRLFGSQNNNYNENLT